jgi:hypothetical protein
MLALPAMTLYAMEKQARSTSEPGRRKDSARSVCVQSVREGSTMARNLWVVDMLVLQLRWLETERILRDIPHLRLLDGQHHLSGPDQFIRFVQVFRYFQCGCVSECVCALLDTRSNNALRCDAMRRVKRPYKKQTEIKYVRQTPSGGIKQPIGTKTSGS